MKILQILILIFGLSIFVNAQKAILNGTVYDYAGSMISNARVEAKSDGGKIFSAYTNDDGFYRLELPEGAYDIEITFSNFNKLRISDYWVSYKMNFDAALQCKNDCKVIGDPIIISEKPVKEQNKIKRKNKNNK